jgi:hypothetical protein
MKSFQVLAKLEIVGILWMHTSFHKFGMNQTREFELDENAKSSLVEVNRNPFTVLTPAGMCGHRSEIRKYKTVYDLQGDSELFSGFPWPIIFKFETSE